MGREAEPIDDVAQFTDLPTIAVMLEKLGGKLAMDFRRKTIKKGEIRAYAAMLYGLSKQMDEIWEAMP